MQTGVAAGSARSRLSPARLFFSSELICIRVRLPATWVAKPSAPAGRSDLDNRFVSPGLAQEVCHSAWPLPFMASQFFRLFGPGDVSRDAGRRSPDRLASRAGRLRLEASDILAAWLPVRSINPKQLVRTSIRAIQA